MVDHRRARRCALVGALLLLAACGGSDDDPVTTTTTTTTSTTTTTAAPTPTTLGEDPYGTAPVPASGEPLGDGKHAVRIVAVDGRRLQVDVVQFLIGAEAEEAAADDGVEAHDFYVRNVDDEVRTVPVAADVEVQALLDQGPEPDPATFDDVVAGEGRLWFIDLSGGDVTLIVEQYLP